MKKISQIAVFLAYTAIAVAVLWRGILPSFYGTGENTLRLRQADAAIEKLAPLYKGDRLLSEVIYNHGGVLGVGKNYRSASGMPISRDAFLERARITTGKAALQRGSTYSYCQSDLQIGFDSAKGQDTYYIYAVVDSTAVHALGCSQT